MTKEQLDAILGDIRAMLCLVADKGAVIDCRITRGAGTLEVAVYAGQHTGQLIGKGGRICNAMRTLAAAIFAKHLRHNKAVTDSIRLVVMDSREAFEAA